MPRRSTRPGRHLDPLVAEAERALAMRRDAVLPNEHDLNMAAQVQPADVTATESLWDEAQRRAGTGLEGLLSAKAVDRNG